MRKSVLITGASRGIGKAIALAFAKETYDLYLTCKSNIDLLTHLCEEIKENFNVACTGYLCDCGNYNDVSQLFSQIPSPDILINNAGIAYSGLLSHMSLEDWNLVMNTNLNSLFYTCRHVIPSMVQKKEGRIINISSVWGEHGSSMEVAYCASKGGVNNFTRALAKELAPSNIQVNAIACGLIDTDMNSCYSTEELQSIVDEIPADRMGRAEEVASLCLSLASSPSYLTGQIITLDGGWM